MDTANCELKDDARYSADMLNFGIGGQAGLKFDFTDTFCATIGLNASYSFATYTHIEKAANDSSEWMLKSMAGLVLL
jgi:hypothetical protein